jgi:uncharacterized protein (DUF952 family)
MLYMEKIFHILSKDDAERASLEGYYQPPSLAEEGFIHCSFAKQVCRIANFLFKGHHDLVILEIDTARTVSKVVVEDLYELGEVFPHIYGKLPWEAVVRIHPLPQNAEGVFQLPASIDE